jgi:hypothetical protein
MAEPTPEEFARQVDRETVDQVVLLHEGGDHA